MYHTSLLTLLLLIPTSVISNQDNICRSNNNVFTVWVNLYAGELGYFEFEECEGSNPTLGMEIGETYTFVQKYPNNWYHPLGFAYKADGAHADEPELEPGVSVPADAPCTLNMTCPAPMYYRNGKYLGVYSNLPGQPPIGDEDFGLDAYEPEFFNPIQEWVGEGEYSVKLTFDDVSYTEDFFYFCHIHEFMSGRIKLLRDGQVINPDNTPPRGYIIDRPGEFDAQCGSYGLDAFQLPNDLCPPRFVCGAPANAEMQKFAQCIDAVNCFMFQGMTTGMRSQSEIALFIHHMIPHHRNAVNMAKTLLHTKKLRCEDLTNEEDPVCVMNAMMHDIINGQNFQIQVMRSVLEALDLPQTDECEVPLDGKQPYVLLPENHNLSPHQYISMNGNQDSSPLHVSQQHKFRMPGRKGNKGRSARRNL